jgi:thymidylate synthase (FAD)
MWVINKVYQQLLGWGCPEEDARYILPNACTTSITVTMNARELQHFCGLRRCTRAQWEIRELADKMAQAAEEACPELFKHFSLGPQCEQLGYCPEHKSCGRYKKEAKQ